MEIVATGESDLDVREETAGRVLSAWKDLRTWRRLLWWKKSGVPAVVLREIRRLTAESDVKCSRLCEHFAENQLEPCVVISLCLDGEPW